MVVYFECVYNRPAAEGGIVVVRCIGEIECCYLRNAQDEQSLVSVSASGGDSVTVPRGEWIVGCGPAIVACSRRSEGTRSCRLGRRTRTNSYSIGAERRDETVRSARCRRWRRAEWTVNVEGHSPIDSRSCSQLHSRSVSRRTTERYG